MVAGVCPDGENLGYAGMLELGQELSFSLESLDGLFTDETDADDLHGDSAIGNLLPGFIDPTHTTFTDKPEDLEAAEISAEKRVYELGGGAGFGSQAKVVVDVLECVGLWDYDRRRSRAWVCRFVHVERIGRAGNGRLSVLVVGIHAMYVDARGLE
jgi:hypothetical protein